MKPKNVITNLSLAIAGGMVTLGGGYIFKEDKIIERTVVEKPVARYVNYKGGNQPVGLDFTQAADASLNSVVHITTETKAKHKSQEEAFFEQYFGRDRSRNQIQRGSGSGVILSTDGYIVTNNHVVEGSDKVEVILNDNRKYTAKIIGTDPSTDLAVIKVDESDLEEIALGNSDDVKVGEWVLAVGNPFNLTSTVTAGIVSAKARSINIMERDIDNDVFPIESFIQTDAAVNPGNSGGALVDAKGNLVGINTAIASQTGSYAGYSFAVPVNLMKKVTADLMKHGVVQRAFIGVGITEVNQEVANELGIDQTEGVLVTDLSDGGSAKDAGIKVGDVIISVNDNEVKSVPALQEQVGKHQPGDIVLVGLYRDNKFQNLNVELKNIEGNTEVIEKIKEVSLNAFGAKLVIPSKKEMASLGIRNGVKVEKLASGRLNDLGIEKGFVITQIDKKKIVSPNQVKKAINDNDGKSFIIEGVYPNGVRAMYQISN